MGTKGECHLLSYGLYLTVHSTESDAASYSEGL